MYDYSNRLTTYEELSNLDTLNCSYNLNEKRSRFEYIIEHFRSIYVSILRLGSIAFRCNDDRERIKIKVTCVIVIRLQWNASEIIAENVPVGQNKNYDERRTFIQYINFKLFHR